MALFADRDAAAAQLIPMLPPEIGPDWIVLALPRGGVPIAAAIAQAIGAPLDLMIVRKVGAPGHPEVALGAVTGAGPEALTVNDRVRRDLDLSRGEVEELAQPAIDEVARRRKAWAGAMPGLPLAGRRVLIVDDGVATGTTLRAAIDAAKAQGAAQIALAVPVALDAALSRLPPDVGPVICPAPEARYPAVGVAYDRFPQVSGDEVLGYMTRAREDQIGDS